MKTFLSAFIAGILLAFILMLSIQTSLADSATWNLNPISSDWNDPLNWTPNTVPNGPSDVATFDVSNTTGVRITHPGDTVDHIAFTSTASSYTLTVGQQSDQNERLIFTGLGIVNDSGLTQNFLPVGSTIEFDNGSNAGLATMFTVPSTGLGSEVLFFDTSSAGSATFDNDRDVEFFDDSTAANATLTGSGSLVFMGNSTAEDATFIIDAPGPFG